MVARETPVPSEPGLEDEEFAAALAATAEVGGWLTPAQARRLWERARALRPGSRIVEIGSFHGRSTIVLARARLEGSELIAIDPHAGGDRLPQTSRHEPPEGQRDFLTFRANLRRADVESHVIHVRSRSLEALPLVAGEVDLLFIDGAHRYQAVRADIERWGARVPPAGTMLLHDSFNAIGVTLAQLRTLVLIDRMEVLRPVRLLRGVSTRVRLRHRVGRWRGPTARSARLLRARPGDQGCACCPDAATGPCARSPDGIVATLMGSFKGRLWHLRGVTSRGEQHE